MPGLISIPDRPCSVYVAVVAFESSCHLVQLPDIVPGVPTVILSNDIG